MSKGKVLVSLCSPQLQNRQGYICECVANSPEVVTQKGNALHITHYFRLD